MATFSFPSFSAPLTPAPLLARSPSSAPSHGDCKASQLPVRLGVGGVQLFPALEGRNVRALWGGVGSNDMSGSRRHSDLSEGQIRWFGWVVDSPLLSR